ncbi:MAG: hypothetical protein QM650_12945 [Microlunatus sp.]
MEAARARFGAPDDALGAVWTRTGRSFFGPELTAELVDRLRSAAERAGLFDELDTGWLLLDAELLPWSAKAGDLLRSQYAAVGAAAAAALPVAVSALARAQARGVEVGELLGWTESRAVNAELFRAAYLRYCWPTDGLAGVRFAPFQLLATEGRAYHDRSHSWHLDLADRLAAVDSELVASTRRLVVDLTSEREIQAGVDWWTELTSVDGDGPGGEGMVVKPLSNLVRTKSGVLQPGLKVRGREYLRIIYGPDYTEPANLTRLRDRKLGHKRSMAATRIGETPSEHIAQTPGLLRTVGGDRDGRSFGYLRRRAGSGARDQGVEVVG